MEKDHSVDKSFSVNHGRPERLPARMNMDVLGKRNEVVESQRSELGRRPADDLTGRPEHVSGVYRFDGSEIKDEVVDEIENGVVEDCEWFKVESHVCDHDEPASERTGCGDWKTERVKGNIPEQV